MATIYTRDGFVFSYYLSILVFYVTVKAKAIKYKPH